MLAVAAAALVAAVPCIEVGAELGRLKARRNAAERAYAAAQAPLRAAQPTPDTPDHRAKFAAVYKSYLLALDEVGRGVVELARRHPGAGFRAVEWYVCGVCVHHGTPGADAALDFAAAHYARDPRALPVIAYVAMYVPYAALPAADGAAERFAAACTDHPDRAARGHARLALAQAAFLRSDRADRERRPDADALAAEAVRRAELLARDYADVAWLDQRKLTLGNRAAALLAELCSLRVGKAAPPLVGETVAGNKFDLLDHRGKVVVVVFWATWCAPCMKAIPHEKELAARYKDRPFAVVGVNGDTDRAKARAAEAAHAVPWPSVWAGPEGPYGPTCRAWNAERWPVVYVLDGAGVVRAKRVAGADLDAAVAALLDAPQAKP